MKNINVKEIIYLGVVLGIVSMIAAILLGTTYSITKPAIEKQRELAIKTAQKLVFPEAITFIPLLNKKTQTEYTDYKIGSATITSIYVAKDDQEKSIGYVINAFTMGYSGNIVFVMGLTMDKKIKDIRVTEIVETPGLGANVGKRKFLDQFMNKSFSDPFAVHSDILAVTSATISSKALTNGIKSIIDFTQNPTLGVLQ
jgi:electron transport complex protein RnfG